MHDATEDLDTALGALARVVEAVEQRTQAVDAATAELFSRRTSYLAACVANLLPATSDSVLLVLNEQVPAFVSAEVQRSFATHRKFLGVFASPAYSQNLALLQIRLASHLDQLKYGELQGIDDQLLQLAAEKSTLATRSRDTLELLRAMQQARDGKVALPEVVNAQVNQIATFARTERRRSIDDSPWGVSFSSTTVYTTDDDSDLLMYLFTDFPFSLRTLILDAVTDQQGGLDWGTDWSDSSDGNRSNSDSANPLAATAAFEIATDDSLGLFS